MSKHGRRTINWFEAIVNKLGGEEAADEFLRGELVVSKLARRWCEHGGVIYLSVTSDGTTGEEWIERLKKKSFRLNDSVKSILCSPDFKTTRGITTKIAILKEMLFGGDCPITKNIHAEADRRVLIKPNAEVACLIRESFSDEDIEAMGLWWIMVMHEPIKDSTSDPGLLGATREFGGRCLGVYCGGGPDSAWHPAHGFAFVVSQ